MYDASDVQLEQKQLLQRVLTALSVIKVSSYFPSLLVVSDTPR